MTTAVQVQYRRGAASQVAAFAGAPGEMVVDTTNNRLVVQDGTTVGGWPAAKLSEVQTVSRTAISDANYAAGASDRVIAYTSLTAGRTVTLPSAASFPAGSTLVVDDETGNCSATKALTILCAGSDTVDGTASAVLANAYAGIILVCNGINKWSILAQTTPGQSATVAQGPNGSQIQVGTLEQLVTLSGTSTATAIQIPNRAIVLAVSTFVVTAITGATSYNVDAATSSSGGTGTSAGQFGANLGIAAGSNNVGVIGPTAWYAASVIKLMANGGSFTGGTVRVAIQSLLCSAPIS